MKLLTIKLITFFFIISSLTNCSSPSKRTPANEEQTDEVLVNIGVPLKTIDRELQNIAKSNEVLKRIDYIHLDPLTRILSIKGIVNYPLKKLFNFGKPVPAEEESDDHTFEFAISFPEAKELAQTNYFRIKFHRFKLNGDDYMNAFSVVSSFIQTIMSNSDLINYVYDKSDPAFAKNPDASAIMKSLIANNGFIVDSTSLSIAVKINTSYFSQLKMYDEIEGLKLWYFGPDHLGGTKNYTVFRLIAGIGKPSEEWISQHSQSVVQDEKRLSQEKSELYKTYTDHAKAAETLTTYFSTLLLNEGISTSKLAPRYLRELEVFTNDLKTGSRLILTPENELFKADPENEYANYIDIQKARARFFITDLSRRLSIDEATLSDADEKSKGLPIVTERISQELLNSSMNFLRDIENDGQFYIKEAKFILAPHIPGIVLKGKVNLELAYILGQIDSSFVGKKIDQSKAITADGIPFEIALETKMGSDSWLGIDPKSVKLLDGKQALTFNRNSRNQRFLLDFIKVYLAQALAPLYVDTTETIEEPTQLKARKLKEMSQHLLKVKTIYQDSFNQNNSENIIKAMNFDLALNPSISAGAEFIKKKGQILFSDIIKYDTKDKLFKIKIDPKIAVDNFAGVNNTLQVWGATPYVSKDLNNTFLEISVGNGPRNRDYVESITKNSNDFDNSAFSGVYQDHDQSAVDFLTSINFHYLENYVNQIFQQMLKAQNGQYEKELAVDKEQSHTILDNLTLKITPEKKIMVNLKVTILAKKKNFLGWARSEKWRIDKDSYSLTAEVTLNPRNLDQIKDQLRPDKLPVYYNKDAIGVTFNRVKVEFGNPSIINSTLSKLTNINLEAPIINKFTSLILKIVSMYFNSQYDSQKVLSGHEIEEMFKVLTTNKEVILLINPRLAGSAFEVKLTGNDNFLEQSLKVDPKKQEVHVAFTASTSMAKLDKRDLVAIAQNSNTLIASYINKNNPADLVKALNTELAVDKIIRASDKTKLSIYNDLLSVVSHYDPVIDVIKTGLSSKSAQKRLTATGVELMYFGGTSYIIYQKVDALVRKIESMKLQGQVLFFNDLKEGRDKLRNNIILPLFRKYQEDHHALSESVVKNYKNYWTYQFYPDAYFAETIYKILQAEMK